MIDHYDSGKIIVVDGNNVFKYARFYDADRRPVFHAPSHEIVKPQSMNANKPGFVFEKYIFLNLAEKDFMAGYSQYGFQYVFYHGDITTIGAATEDRLSGICETTMYMDLSRIFYHISGSNEVIIDRKYDLLIPVQEYTITTGAGDLTKEIEERICSSVTFFNRFYEEREV